MTVDSTPSRSLNDCFLHRGRPTSSECLGDKGVACQAGGPVIAFVAKRSPASASADESSVADALPRREDASTVKGIVRDAGCGSGRSSRGSDYGALESESDAL